MAVSASHIAVTDPFEYYGLFWNLDPYPQPEESIPRPPSPRSDSVSNPIPSHPSAQIRIGSSTTPVENRTPVERERYDWQERTDQSSSRYTTISSRLVGRNAELPVYQLRTDPPAGGELPPPYQQHDPLGTSHPALTLATTLFPHLSHLSHSRSLSRFFSPRSSIPPSSVTLQRPVSAPPSRPTYCPRFAIGTPKQPFTQLSDLKAPPKAFLINKPFTGSFNPYPSLYPLSHPTRLPHPQIAIAVYARYDFRSKRIWLAVQHIWTAKSETGRQEETKWKRIDAFIEQEANGWPMPGRQRFAAFEKYKGEGEGEGERIVCEKKLKRKWLEYNTERMKGFGGVDEV